MQELPETKAEIDRVDDRNGEFYEALVRRNAAFADRFLYGVLTTRVYCSPTCASRKPRREHVEFFADTMSARAHGYRPCKRCRPNGGDAPDQRILQACSMIEQSDGPLGLKVLATAVGLSETYFQRRFKKEIGVSPRRYAQRTRQGRLRAHLQEPGTITKAIYDAVFASSSAVYATASSSLGMTRTQFQAGGETTHVLYAIVHSVLGFVLVATTSLGVCKVDIDRENASLERRLREEFPRASLERAEDKIESTTSLVVEYLSGNKIWPRLPIHVRATAFQMRAWDAVRNIASGTTLTYGELATAIGSPSAVRAVARACAINPIALLIPCHRIVPAGGGVGGYHWGRTRKAQLLEIERSQLTKATP